MTQNGYIKGLKKFTRNKQNWQRTDTLSLWRVHVTIFAVDVQ